MGQVLQKPINKDTDKERTTVLALLQDPFIKLKGRLHSLQAQLTAHKNQTTELFLLLNIHMCKSKPTQTTTKMKIYFIFGWFDFLELKLLYCSKTVLINVPQSLVWDRTDIMWFSHHSVCPLHSWHNHLNLWNLNKLNDKCAAIKYLSQQRSHLDTGLLPVPAVS